MGDSQIELSKVESRDLANGSVQESAAVYQAVTGGNPTGGPGSIVSKRWPADTIEAAYRIWAGPADRNCAAVVRMLSSSVGVTVPGNTVRSWVHDYDWTGKRKAESRDAVEDDAERFSSTVWVAAPQAVRLIQDTITGRIDPTDKQLKAAIHIETAARSLLLKQADLSSKDGRKSKPTPRISQAPVDYASLSPDELDQLEQHRRTGRGSAV